MIAAQLGAVLLALAVLAVELPERSRVLLALLPFVLLAGWPRRERSAGALLWLATALPVVGLAVRLDLAFARAPWALLGLAATGLGLVAALAACARRAAGEPRFAIAWSFLVPGLAVLAWAWDHGTAAESSWPAWSALSPLGWVARWATMGRGDDLAAVFGPLALGPWLGVGLLWAAGRRPGER